MEWSGVSTINLIIQYAHSIQVADVGMLQTDKAETKPYVEENITITYLYVIMSKAI